MLAQKIAFDGQLVVGDTEYGKNIILWVRKNLGNFPKEKNEKVNYINYCIGREPSFKEWMQQLCKDLAELIKEKNHQETESIWSEIRAQESSMPPRARNTFVRRGLSKLLIFEDTDLALKVFRSGKVKSTEVPPYAYEIGL